MSTEVIVSLIGLVGIITAPILGYVAASRKLSGQIETSSADELWDEARDIRADYVRRLKEADGKIVAMEQKVADCTAQNQQLREDNVELRKDLRKALDEINTLKGQVRGLTKRRG